MLLGFWTLLYLARVSMQDSVSGHLSPKIQEFSCVGKVIGGYYADVQSNCQMFHVCTLGEKGELQDIAFLCIKGTAFKQESRVCERENEVDCSESEKFYYLNEELYGPGIIPDTAIPVYGNYLEAFPIVKSSRYSYPVDKDKIYKLSNCNGKTENCISRDLENIKLLKNKNSLYQNDIISLLIFNENNNHLVVKRDTSVDLNRNSASNSRNQALVKDSINHKKRNNTIVEVSEIVSPDHSGRVIITSIVPKLVTQNIFTEKEKDVPKVSVSTGQSKVVVSSETSPLATEKTEEISQTTVTTESETSVSPTEAPEEPVTTTTEEAITITEMSTPLKNISQNTTKPANTTVSSIQEDTSGVSEEGIIETNFTCKDKELERFYPDIEAECKVFHYCAPGFSEDQVLDLKFLCTGNTRFDSKTSKCQDKNQVTCAEPTASDGPAFSESPSGEPSIATTPSTTKTPETTSPVATTTSTASSTTTLATTILTTTSSTTQSSTTAATTTAATTTSPQPTQSSTISSSILSSNSDSSQVSESEIEVSTESQLLDNATILPTALKISDLSNINIINESSIDEMGDIESKITDSVTIDISEAVSDGIALTTMLNDESEASVLEQSYNESSTEADLVNLEYETDYKSEPLLYDNLELTTIDTFNTSHDITKNNENVYSSTIVR